MLADIQGMCDEVEYMQHVGELNLAENLAFADQVAQIAGRMQQTVEEKHDAANRTTA
jgi:hypothetical protein